jgi:hypothetical protein
MSIKTREELKSYFKTRDKPTQAQFEHLFDSLTHKKGDTPLSFRGGFNDNAFPQSGGNGPAGTILAGNMWRIDAECTIAGTLLKVGDALIALIDNPDQPEDWWMIRFNQSSGGNTSGDHSPYAIKDLDEGITEDHLNRFVVLKDDNTVMLPVGVTREGSLGSFSIQCWNVPAAPGTEGVRVNFQETGFGGSNFSDGDTIRIIQDIDPSVVTGLMGEDFSPFPDAGDNKRLFDYTFTFRNSPSSSFEVQIGGSLSLSLANLAAVITSNLTSINGADTTIGDIGSPYIYASQFMSDEYFDIYYGGFYYGNRPSTWGLASLASVIVTSDDIELESLSSGALDNSSCLSPDYLADTAIRINADLRSANITWEEVFTAWLEDNAPYVSDIEYNKFGYYKVPKSSAEMTLLAIKHACELNGLIDPYWDIVYEFNDPDHLLHFTTKEDPQTLNIVEVSVGEQFTDYQKYGDVIQPVEGYTNRVIAPIYGQLVGVTEDQKAIVYIGKGYSNVILDEDSEPLGRHPAFELFYESLMEEFEDNMEELISSIPGATEDDFATAEAFIAFLDSLERDTLFNSELSLVYLLATLNRIAEIIPGGKVTNFNLLEKLMAGNMDGDAFQFLLFYSSDKRLMVEEQNLILPNTTCTANRFNLIKLLLDEFGEQLLLEATGGFGDILG